MNADLIAFSVLGLRPGADAAEVEAAYRRLIKAHHPDREGGDSDRAAEINWAYHHLRKAQQLPMTRLSHYPVVQPTRVAGARGSWFGLVLVALAILVLMNVGAIGRAIDGLRIAWTEPGERGRPAALGNANDLDQPLMSEMIDRSAILAAELARSGESARLVDGSRHCHAELRREPVLARLDQCVAFDEAAALLLEADQPGSAQFSASAVTGRQLSAARLFPGGYPMVESRLDRIRARVAFTLAPADSQPAPPIEF